MRSPNVVVFVVIVVDAVVVFLGVVVVGFG